MSSADFFQWAGTGLVALLTAWGGMRAERWKAKRDEKTDEQARYDTLWAKLEKMNAEVEAERDAYRVKWSESEQQRMHEGEACEKRIREARRESQAEADEIRDQMRKLSKLCHAQQLEIDQAKNEVSSLKAKIASEIAIPGGRRASDPPAAATVEQ